MAITIRIVRKPDHTIPELPGSVREFLYGLVLGIIERPPDGYYHVNPGDVYASLLSQAPQHATILRHICSGYVDLAIPYQVCRKLSDERPIRLGFDLTIADMVSAG